uniref:Uncharacterized protein n=1 Tax=Solanum tuberosum TaxID=4113 RepID=M1BM41_SOLTU
MLEDTEEAKSERTSFNTAMIEKFQVRVAIISTSKALTDAMIQRPLKTSSIRICQSELGNKDTCKDLHRLSSVYGLEELTIIFIEISILPLIPFCSFVTPPLICLLNRLNPIGINTSV